MSGSILGNAVVGVEDAALITGCGTFVDNRRPGGVLHACFVRSPVAHAHPGAIDTEAAASAPGVIGVFTGADLDLKPSFPFCEYSEHCARPPLAVDRVRFVGEPVAAVNRRKHR